MTEVHIFATYRVPSIVDQANTCHECGSDRTTNSPRPDGKFGCIRHCSDCGATMQFKPIDEMPGRPLVYPWETEVVWLEDIERLDYVREHIGPAFGSGHEPPIHAGPGRLVGYSLLAKEASAVMSACSRTFMLYEYDRDSDPEGAYEKMAPIEAVDPRTVLPGYAGQTTSRVGYKDFRMLEAAEDPAEKD